MRSGPDSMKVHQRRLSETRPAWNRSKISPAGRCRMSGYSNRALSKANVVLNNQRGDDEQDRGGRSMVMS
jgi:hypothetical protein